MGGATDGMVNSWYRVFSPAASVLGAAILMAAWSAPGLAQNIRPRPDQTPTVGQVLEPATVLGLLERYYGPDLKSYSETIDYYPAAGVRSSLEFLLRRAGPDPLKQPPAILIHGLNGGQVILVCWKGKLIFATAEDPTERELNLPVDQLGKLFDGTLDANLTRRLAILPHLPFVIFGNPREVILAGKPRMSAYYPAAAPGFVCLQAEYPDGTSTVYYLKAETGQIRRIERTTAAGKATVDIPAMLPGRDPFLKDELFEKHLPTSHSTPVPVRPTSAPGVTPTAGAGPATPVPTPGAVPTPALPATPTASPTPMPILGAGFVIDHPMLYKLAPDFSYPTAQASKGQLFEYLGRVVILVFWDSACANVEALVAGLKNYAAAQAPDVVVFVINTRQEVGPAMELLAKVNDPRVISILDAGQAGAQARYGVSQVPTIFVLDPTLNVRGVYVGYRDDTVKLLTETASKYLPRPATNKSAASQP